MKQRAAEQPRPLAKAEPHGRMYAALEAAPDMVVVYRSGRISYANAAARAFLCRSLKEDPVGLVYDAAIWNGDARDNAATSGVRPAASLLPRLSTLEVREVPIDVEGEREMVVFVHDVRQQRTRELNRLRDAHVASLRALASGVVSELGDPLTSTIVNTEHVLRRLRALVASGRFEEGIDAESVHEVFGALEGSLAQALDGAMRARNVLRSVLTFASASRESRSLVDVRAVLESSLHMAWHELRPRAQVEKSLAEVPPVAASEARLGQVFLSLLINAAQSVPEGRAHEQFVRLATYCDPAGRVVVEVADTGRGIAEDDLPHVFDPYFSKREGESGAGLGLAIAHGIVSSLGGEIAVESVEGEGSIFRVILEPARGWRSNTPAPRERTRVLVIEEDPLVGGALALALHDDSAVTVLTRATEALELLGAGERYDAIVCELSMGELSGVDFYAEVVRIAPESARRIIFTTGAGLTARSRAFLDSVRRPHLAMPVDGGELRRAVGQVARASADRG